MSEHDTENAFRNYRNTKHFGSLDGLRCICISLVLWHHAPNIFSQNVEVPMVLTRGFTGVDFFFVLSGYLITTLLLREEDRYGRFSIVEFYRRRLLRIVPIYFLVVTLTAIWWIGVRGQTEWLAYLPYYYLFLANFLVGDIPLLAPMWSLSVEEQYYVLWPALLLLLPILRWRIAVVVPAIALIYAADAALLPRMTLARTENFHAAIPVVGYGAILIGSLAAILLHTHTGFGLLWRLLGNRWTSAGLFILLVIAWQVMPGDLRGWPNFVMHWIMACIVVSLVIREDHVLKVALQWRPIARIGAISYGIYLWHLYGLHIGNEMAFALGLEKLAAARAAFPIYLVSSVIIAEISYRYFESYFLALKKRSRVDAGRIPPLSGSG